ncbi:MAG: hypothetical protein Q7J16_09295 [Candidatus Cloacimonadales bacterium]|nr:hypothetical protein [Candidatus Cloacimonadales bacterium]
MKANLILFLFALLLASCATMEKGYQENADEIRLQHLRYYGDLLDEYYNKCGQYPFQDEVDVPIYVTIANEFQKKNANQRLPFEHQTRTSEEFKQEIKNVLGREIELRYDPQKVGVYAPNFYIYSIYQKVFYFAIHLYNEYDYSKIVSKHYNKLELTNNRDLYPGQIHFDKLKILTKKNSEKLSKEELDVHTNLPTKDLLVSNPVAFNDNAGTQYAEIYISFHSESQYLRIKEYKLSAADSTANIVDLAIDLRNKVVTNSYFNNKYGFENWLCLEEKIYRDREIVTSVGDFLTKEKDIPTLLSDCFGKILNRPIRIISTEHLTSLSFTSENIRANSENGNAFEKEGLMLILWDNMLDDFDLVLTYEVPIDDKLSLFDYLEVDLESPEISEEKIEKWRN